MKPLNLYIQEKLIVNKNYNPYTCVPKSFDELKQIIQKRYKEQGPGTQQDPIDFNDIDVSKITAFFDEAKYKGIFEKTKFAYIDVSEWNVSNVEEMSRMFYKCKNLKSVGDISNWVVSNVKHMGNMFRECENLIFIGDLSNWDVSRVESVNYMFRDCINLKSIGDISGWDVSKVKDNMLFVFADSGITNIPDWYKE